MDKSFGTLNKLARLIVWFACSSLAAAGAQTIQAPASSVDNGSRAVVSITPVNTSNFATKSEVNNAYNLANSAYNYAASAYSYAGAAYSNATSSGEMCGAVGLYNNTTAAPCRGYTPYFYFDGSTYQVGGCPPGYYGRVISMLHPATWGGCFRA